MPEYLTSTGPRYIPQGLRLTGLLPPKAAKAGTTPAQNKEMQEIRQMEDDGIILVDELTESEVYRDKINGKGRGTVARKPRPKKYGTRKH